MDRFLIKFGDYPTFDNSVYRGADYELILKYVLLIHFF